MSYRKRGKVLGLFELIAIALGGMIGGGIFSILGISVSIIGFATPVAIIIGGIIALFAAYAYVKLGVFYQDEGATYVFYKKTYPNSRFFPAMIGWYIIFGYISTLALYSYTFAAYAISDTFLANNIWVRKSVSLGILAVFTIINLWSVKGMGKVEDIMVYSKLIIMFIISVVLMMNGKTTFGSFIKILLTDVKNTSFFSILIVSSITFVSYEGFQLVNNAVNEMYNPEKNIPRAIYSAVLFAIIIYVILSLGALFAIPKSELIAKQEYALAAGAEQVLGKVGIFFVILGALLATSSAISGTVFGSSRQMAAIAKDGYFPKFLEEYSENGIPKKAVLAMTISASILVIIGGLKLILEFGSITFLIVSFLMTIANYKIREKTNSSLLLSFLAILSLGISGFLILYYEFTEKPEQMFFILVIYVLLTLGAWIFAKRKKRYDNYN